MTEAGVYAYANELLGKRQVADPYIALLRNSTDESAAYSALVWLADIDETRGDFEAALRERKMIYSRERKIIRDALDDSVTKNLRDEAVRQTEDERTRVRMILIISGGIFFALLSVFL